MIYGAGWWGLTNKMERNSEAWERKLLGKLYGPPSGNGYWSIKMNQDIYNILQSSDIITVIEVSRSQWLGHVAGMGGQ
jgi:hypothetical protein